MIHDLISLTGWLILGAVAFLLSDRWRQRRALPMHHFLVKRGFRLIEDETPDNFCYAKRDASVWVSHQSRTWRLHCGVVVVAGQGVALLHKAIEERGI